MIAASVVVGLWAASGMAGYRVLEGRWSWVCLLGVIYGPWIWLGVLMAGD